MIRFEKVSFTEFLNSCRTPECWYLDSVSDEDIKKWYDEIRLPRRSSKGSAGYDFHFPLNMEFKLGAGTVFFFPTGVRVTMPDDICLFVAPRSGFGFTTETRLVNTLGIIDASYVTTPNEGHIKCKVRVGELEDEIVIKHQDRLIQGVFVKCYFTDDDDVTVERTGGFGSSGR